MDRGKHSNIIFDVVIFLLGVFLIIYSWVYQENFLTTFYVLMGIYGIIKIVQYKLQKNKKDRENLYSGFACILVIFCQFLRFLNNNMILTFSLLAWISMISIIKLVKLDYLHDRSLPMFKVRLVGFLLFVLLGVITNYTLLFNPSAQQEIVSYFLIINGMIYIGEGLIREYDFQLSEPEKAKKKKTTKAVKKKNISKKV